ncbi:MAG: acyl-CoA thioesterase [Planctomycetaceae bacterium]
MDTHELEIRVRYNETDSMGFLHHAQYFVYFELGRTELLRARGGNYRDIEAAGLFMVVVQLECRFRKSARYDELLTLQTTLEKITPAKMH